MLTRERLDDMLATLRQIPGRSLLSLRYVPEGESAPLDYQGELVESGAHKGAPYLVLRTLDGPRRFVCAPGRLVGIEIGRLGPPERHGSRKAKGMARKTAAPLAPVAPLSYARDGFALVVTYPAGTTLGQIGDTWTHDWKRGLTHGGQRWIVGTFDGETARCWSPDLKAAS